MGDYDHHDLHHEYGHHVDVHDVPIVIHEHHEEPYVEYHIHHQTHPELSHHYDHKEDVTPTDYHEHAVLRAVDIPDHHSYHGPLEKTSIHEILPHVERRETEHHSVEHEFVDHETDHEIDHRTFHHDDEHRRVAFQDTHYHHDDDHYGHHYDDHHHHRTEWEVTVPHETVSHDVERYASHEVVPVDHETVHHDYETIYTYPTGDPHHPHDPHHHPVVDIHEHSYTEPTRTHYGHPEHYESEHTSQHQYTEEHTIDPVVTGHHHDYFSAPHVTEAAHHIDTHHDDHHYDEHHLAHEPVLHDSHSVHVDPIYHHDAGFTYHTADYAHHPHAASHEVEYELSHDGSVHMYEEVPYGYGHGFLQ